MSDILTPSRKHLIPLSCWCWCLLFPRSLLVFFLFIFFSTTIVGVIVHGLVCLLGTLSPPVVLYCPTNTILPSLDLCNCTTVQLYNCTTVLSHHWCPTNTTPHWICTTVLSQQPTTVPPLQLYLHNYTILHILTRTSHWTLGKCIYTFLSCFDIFPFFWKDDLVHSDTMYAFPILAMISMPVYAIERHRIVIWLVSTRPPRALLGGGKLP